MIPSISYGGKGLTVNLFEKGIFTTKMYAFPTAVSKDEYDTPSNKHYINEVTLTRQNLPLKCCNPLDFLTHFKKMKVFQ